MKTIHFILFAVFVAVVATMIVANNSQPVSFVNTEQQYAADTCVPQDSGVLSLAVQRVNHIVAPECEDTF